MNKELYIFSKDDELLTILSEETGLIDTHFKDYENLISDEAFVFNVDNSAEYSQGYSTNQDGDNNLTQVAGSFIGTMGNVNSIETVSPINFIEEENQIAFYDRDNNLRMMRIKESYDNTTSDGSLIKVVCEPAYLELYDHFVEDRRVTQGTAQTALDRVLDGSRYVGEVTINLGNATDNFYWINGIEAIWKILNTWGGALKDTITLDGNNNITQRKIMIVQRLGSDKGLIVEPDYNADTISRKTLSYVETALYGQGASLETEDGGNTRYITFEDVEWKISNGDPTDKPLGQKWVGDTDALAEYEYLHNGVKNHRYGHFSNQDYDNPEDLLMATWLDLQERKLKEIIHEVTIYEDEKSVSLGDTVTVTSREYNKPIELQSQITGLEYDILDDKDIKIIIGKYVNMNEDPLQQEVDEIKDAVKKPVRVTDTSFPDIKPGIPMNVTATGAFQTIQVFWDYDSKIYISNYEVYASKVSDFVPDTQFLVYRGDVSTFSHEVATDEMWYYYVRAVNTRGTVGEFSNRVSAETVRIITDDMLFGEELAEKLRDLNTVSDIIGEGNVDLGNLHDSLPDYFKQQAVDYTDEEVLEVKNDLLNDIADKADLDYVDGQFIDKIGNVVDMIQVNEANISSNEISLTSKIEQSTYDAFRDSADNRFSIINQTFDEINQTVSNIIIGGGNLFKNTVGPDQPVGHDLTDNGTIDIASTGKVTLKEGNYTAHTMYFPLSVDVIIKPIIRYKVNNNYADIEGNEIQTIAGNYTHIVFTFELPDNVEEVKFLLKSVGSGAFSTTDSSKLEEGTEATDWKPSLDQFDGRLIQAESNINQNASKIDLKVNIDGVVSEINLMREGIRLKGDLIHLDGLTIIDDSVIQSAHIKNGAITNLKVGRAAIDTLQVKDGAIDNAKIKDLAVDNAKIGNVSVTKLLAGTIDTDKIKIRGGSATDYTLIDGSYFESRGRYTRNWRGSTKTHDVRLKFENGYLRARNEDEDQSIYFSDFGISTYANGVGDERGPSSGTLEFFSYEFSDYRGITLHSNDGIVGLKSETNRIVIEATHPDMTVDIPGDKLRTQGVGVIEPLSNLYLGASGERDGEVRITDKNFYNDGNIRYMPIRASEFKRGDGMSAYINGTGSASFVASDVSVLLSGGIRTIGTHFYIGVTAGDGGELRVTSSTGYNEGGSIGYRPVRASNFHQASSIEYKTNIENVGNIGLETINALSVLEYDLIGDIDNGVTDNRQLGFIAEYSESVASSDNSAIDIYKLSSYNTLAIQELSQEVERLKELINNA